MIQVEDKQKYRQQDTNQSNFFNFNNKMYHKKFDQFQNLAFGQNDKVGIKGFCFPKIRKKQPYFILKITIICMRTIKPCYFMLQESQTREMLNIYKNYQRAINFSLSQRTIHFIIREKIGLNLVARIKIHEVTEKYFFSNSMTIFHSNFILDHQHKPSLNSTKSIPNTQCDPILQPTPSHSYQPPTLPHPLINLHPIHSYNQLIISKMTQNFSKRQLQYINKFKLADTDGNLFIDDKEFKENSQDFGMMKGKPYTKQEMDEHMRKYDLNGDGFISQDEYMFVMKQRNQ